MTTLLRSISNNSENKDTNHLLLHLIITWLLIFLFVFKTDLAVTLKNVLLIASFLVSFFSTKYAFTIYLLSSTRVLSFLGFTDVSNNIDFNSYLFMATAGSFFHYLLESVKGNYPTNSKRQLLTISIYLLFVAMAFSIVIARLIWGQPLTLGMINFRQYVGLLMVFPLSRWIKSKDHLLYLVKYSIVTCVLACLLFIFQYFVVPNNLFLKVDVTYRDGSKMRYLMHLLSPMLCFFVGYILISIKDNHKRGVLTKKELVLFCCLVIMVITEMLVSGTRIFSISMIIEILLIVFFFDRFYKGVWKGVILGIVVLLFGSEIWSLLSNILHGVFFDVYEQGSNYGRLVEFRYFWNILKDSPLFGVGVLDGNYVNNPLLSANSNRYYLTDLGTFSFFFTFGIFGILGFVNLFIIMIRLSKFSKIREMRRWVWILIIATVVQALTVSIWQQQQVLVLLLSIELATLNPNLNIEKNEYKGEKAC